MALLTISKLKDAMVEFFSGLLWPWLIMAFGLASILGKDLLLMVSATFLNAPGVLPLNLIALTYQCIVMLMSNSAPVCTCLW